MGKALPSLLAGDLFRGTLIHWSVRVFKCLYYVNNLSNPWRSINAWRGRKRAMRNRQSKSQAHA